MVAQGSVQQTQSIPALHVNCWHSNRGYLKNQTIFSFFLSCYRNTHESLGKRKKPLKLTDKWVLSNFHKCFYINSLKAQRKCFFFILFPKTAWLNWKNVTCLFLLSKCKLSLLVLSLHQQLMLALCLYQVIEVDLLACAFLQGVF